MDKKLGRGGAFLLLEGKERPLLLISVVDMNAEVACLSSDGRRLIFPVSKIKALPKGKGIKLISPDGGFQIKALATCA